MKVCKQKEHCPPFWSIISPPQTPSSTKEQCSWTLLYFIYFNTSINKFADFSALPIDIFLFRQWAFDYFHPSKYQKFKIDTLPKIIYYEKWGYTNYIPYPEWKYGKKIKPVHRCRECNIDNQCIYPRCNAPKPL